MAMEAKRRAAGLHPGWWALVFVLAMISIIPFTALAFNRDFTSYARVTVVSDRAGLVMEPYAMVKFRGVVVGRVASIQFDDPVKLRLEVNSDQLTFIPANVGAQISASTVFGGKFVELVAPGQPSRKRLAAGAVVNSSNVSIEANTVFQNVVGVLNQIDTAKLNAVLSALAEGFRGKGEAIGEAITDFNQVLLAVNPRSETIRADYRALKGFADTYSAAAGNLLTVLDAATTTSTTINENAKALNSLLLNAVGLSNSGINLIGPNRDNLVRGINVLEPTTRLLMKYNPELTCMLSRREKGPRHGLAGRRRRPRRQVRDPGHQLVVRARTSTAIRITCPSTGRRVDRGERPAVVRCPMSARTGRCVTGHQFRMGHRARRPAQPGYRLPGLHRLFAGHPRHTRASEFRLPGRSRAGADSVSSPSSGMYLPGCAAYGAPGTHPDGTPLYPGLAAGAAARRPREPGPPPEVRAIRAPVPGVMQPTPGRSRTAMRSAAAAPPRLPPRPRLRGS